MAAILVSRSSCCYYIARVHTLSCAFETSGFECRVCRYVVKRGQPQGRGIVVVVVDRKVTVHVPCTLMALHLVVRSAVAWIAWLAGSGVF